MPLLHATVTVDDAKTAFQGEAGSSGRLLAPSSRRAPHATKALALAALVLCLVFGTGCSSETVPIASGHNEPQASQPYDAGDNAAGSSAFTAPPYSGYPSDDVDDGRADFSEEEIARARLGAFEEYWPLDHLGRATGAFACAGPETLPTEKRGSIGEVKPSGWQISKYDWVDGAYLYNRCHLIGYQITAENANERNLITGTRYLNVSGMLPFENEVAAYIKETGNHVLYRTTVVYEGDNLLASGVRIEAFSIEDGGSGIDFDVYCHNVQPGVEIDYTTGDNRADDTYDPGESENSRYILNTNTKRIHRAECDSAKDIKDSNKKAYDGGVEDAEARGYVPCSRCNP